jgi:hypothetical protein
VSERTKALEAESSRLLLRLLDAACDEPDYAPAADAFVWKIVETTIAKVQENLLGETESIRRIAAALPGETTYGAVKRLASERDGLAKKYREAQAAWKKERAKLRAAAEG